MRSSERESLTAVPLCRMPDIALSRRAAVESLQGLISVDSRDQHA